MARGQDLRRLINGITLIAKEMAKRSEFVETARKGDLDHLISSSLKQLFVSATDLAGLTKGTVNEYSNSNPKPKETVVHFSNPPSPETLESETVEEVRFSESELINVGEIREELRFSNSELRNDGEIRDSETVENITSHQEIPEVSAEVDSGNPVVAESLIRNDLEKDCEPENLQGEDGGREGGQVPMKSENRRRLRERPVPSTSFSRAIGFAGLAAGLAWGTIQESSKRIVYGQDKQSSSSSSSSPMLSEENAKRLALGLCRMRGAALKVGQMLSIQDESLVPAPILAALDIVRQGADIMPRSQLNQVLEAELGSNWTAKFQSFDYEPIAAASIGQVHRAVTNNGLEVAMKIQYPGVANSIQSDINNVKLLLDYTRLIPKGLYLDRAMEVAKEELSQECDYVLEAMNQKRFRDLLSDSETQGFYVPAVVDDISSSRVLTTELVYGIPIDKVALLTQEIRNYVGRKLLELTLMELFVFRFMQTDPNWSNFLYDERTGIINLIDFGAAREYPKTFVDNYLRMVLACANCDRDTSIDMSRRLGFLTGMESEIMVDAHVQAGFVVGLPFSKQGEYDFRSTNIAQSISNLGGTMLRHRLTPPPAEAYSLHRKLSGAFLACIKLGAVVPCRELLLKVYEQYPFADDGVDVQLSSSLS